MYITKDEFCYLLYGEIPALLTANVALYRAECNIRGYMAHVCKALKYEEEGTVVGMKPWRTPSFREKGQWDKVQRKTNRITA